MTGVKPSKDSDEKRFNETVQRMLKTPPKPHEKSAKDKAQDQPSKKAGKEKTN